MGRRQYLAAQAVPQPSIVTLLILLLIALLAGRRGTLSEVRSNLGWDGVGGAESGRWKVMQKYSCQYQITLSKEADVVPSRRQTGWRWLQSGAWLSQEVLNERRVEHVKAIRSLTLSRPL